MAVLCLDVIRTRASEQLAAMQRDEHGVGFAAPEDDPTGISLIRTAADALAAHLATGDFDCGAQALVMLERGIALMMSRAPAK